MLNKKIEEAINNQINAEIYSSYMYYSMAAYFESISLKGFSHWMRVQALEELTHVQKFATFINDRGGRVLMAQVDGPPTEWESPMAAFVAVYEHEVKVTGLINKLMDLALEESDHATVNFMQWFVGEQVEEEASADEVVQRLRLVDKTEGGLFLLDQELDKRTFVLPPDLAGVF
ncbi:MAG: ferritin [Deltaproteobacteria bacterium]|nr:ferritin [Deltaproteobacteria bacterium]